MTSHKRSRSEDARIDGLSDDVAQKRQKLVDAKREYKQAVDRRDADSGYQARMAEEKAKLQQAELKRTKSQQEVALKEQVVKWSNILTKQDAKAAEWLVDKMPMLLAGPVEFGERAREVCNGGCMQWWRVAEYTSRGKVFRVTATTDDQPKFTCRLVLCPEDQPKPSLLALRAEELERIARPRDFPWAAIANDLDDEWLPAAIVMRFWKLLLA